MEFFRNIISRKGSEVIIRDNKGKLWKTHRVKRRHNSRRGIITDNFRSVRYIPIERIIEKGDWIFTCAMEPLQFSHWDKPRDYREYGITEEQWVQMSSAEKDRWLHDGFETIGGSYHSRYGCSLIPISDEYAAFFIEHKLWNLFEINGSNFDKYEEAVKKVCEAFQIKFEGI